MKKTFPHHFEKWISSATEKCGAKNKILALSTLGEKPFLVFGAIGETRYNPKVSDGIGVGWNPDEGLHRLR
ncbi:hypothetical protein TNCT_409421 [Trichonephila clavata]|uniref:Uncharacterized protein n=1 Tax=Trichonephila clavata TaxID=2740835 RepID=A0A8X6LA26_TRICU|nr:hypothetical protein TNCT_409421 [Trichonephila clavata]